jgi:hypothetical protein
MAMDDWPYASQSYATWGMKQLAAFHDSLIGFSTANVNDLFRKLTVYDGAVAVLAFIFFLALIYTLWSSAASLVLKRRVNKMRHWERETLVDNAIAEAVVDKINDLCNNGIITNKQALAKYQHWANVLGIVDLKPRGKGYYLRLKEVIQQRIAERSPCIPVPIPMKDEPQSLGPKPEREEKKEPLSRRSKPIAA